MFKLTSFHTYPSRGHCHETERQHRLNYTILHEGQLILFLHFTICIIILHASNTGAVKRLS